MRSSNKIKIKPTREVQMARKKTESTFNSAVLLIFLGLALIAVSFVITAYMPNIIEFFTFASLWSLMVTPLIILVAAMLTLSLTILGTILVVSSIISTITQLAEYFKVIRSLVPSTTPVSTARQPESAESIPAIQTSIPTIQTAAPTTRITAPASAVYTPSYAAATIPPNNVIAQNIDTTTVAEGENNQTQYLPA